MMRRITLLSITALFVFSASMFAQQGSLQGTYVGTGGGAAIFAFCGFNDNGIPNGASVGTYSTFVTNTQGRWTFNPDGTGSLQAKINVISLPNAAFPPTPSADAVMFPWSGENRATAEFTYTLNPGSGNLDITITNSDQNWTRGPLAGVTGSLPAPFSIGDAVVSQDRKSIKFDTHNEIRTLDLTLPGCAGPAQIANQLSSIAVRQDSAPKLF